MDTGNSASSSVDKILTPRLITATPLGAKDIIAIRLITALQLGRDRHP